jgi:hypothetical protein
VGLRRRRRDESDLIEVVRAELESIRNEVQATLAETAATLSTRVRTEIEQRMGEPSAIASGIQGVREIVAARESELTVVLRQVVETCESLAERVQIDRIERAALIDAISRLTSVVAATAPFSRAPMPAPPPAPPRETVIGGSVDPARVQSQTEVVAPLASETNVEIDLEAESRTSEPASTPPTLPVRPDGVEVRCRFGDRWVTGFEVCEVIRLDDRTRYRLRRRSDGSVIPTLFDEKDLRFFSTTFVDPV